MIFPPRFTCLPANQSPLWRFTHLEVHVLKGITRLTRNRVPHNQHKMRIHKPRTIHKSCLWCSTRECIRTPHNHNDQSRRQSPFSARRSTNHRAIQVSANTKSNKISTSPNHSTSATRCQNTKQCTRGSPISLKMMKSSVQVSGCNTLVVTLYNFLLKHCMSIIFMCKCV